MASLSNTKIKDTYESLVKFSDNGNITIGAKQLTDGFGNNSPFFVSTTQIGIGVTPTIGYDLHVNSDAKIGGNLIVSGNLTVSGTLTYLDVEDLATEDPLIKLARNNAGNSLDIGYFGQYVESAVTKYKGLFNDADDNKFKLFIGTSTEPTTIVNTGGTGYTVGTLVANLEGNVTGTVSSLSNHTTTNLAEGTNLYYTNARADARVNLQTGANLDLSSKDTDDLSEGSTNLYFTTTRARASFTEGTGVTITDGEIAIGQAVATDSNVTFGNITGSAISGTTGTFSGDLSANNLSGTNTGDQTLPTDFVSKANGGTFGGSVTATGFSGPLTGNVTGNLTGNVTGDVTGNAYLNTIAYQGGEGTELDNSAFNVDGIGTNFRWIESNSGSTGSTWKKVADVVLNNVGFKNGVQIEVKVLQPNTYWGDNASLNTIYYSIAFRGDESDAGPFYDDALVYGQDANLIRVYKTSAHNYELQARSNDDNRDLIVECNITSKRSAKVTFTTAYTDGTATGGTAYTASGNALNKTKFAGNVEFEGAVFDDAEVEDLRVNEFLYFGSGATSGYGPHIQHSDSGGTGKGMRITVDSDLQVWGVTGNAGEQNQGLYVAGGVAKLYDSNGVVLETVLGGVDITGTLEVSSTITGNLTGDITGDVTGDLTGDVTGDLTGSVTGAASLNVLKAGDTMTGDLILNDDVKANFGTDSDLEIYHDGTDGYIDNINGELIIQNNSNDKKIIFKSDNGIGDITEYFRIDGNINRNVITVTTQLNDNVPLIFGSGAGSPSIKYDSTASQLFISGESKFLNNAYVVGDLIVDTDTLFVDVSADKVGINNSAPGAMLTIGTAINANATGLEVNAGTGGGNIISRGAGYDNWFPYTNGENYYSSDTHNFRNTASSAAQLTIDSSGNGTFVGAVTASSFSGPLTGNVTGNFNGGLITATANTNGGFQHTFYNSNTGTSAFAELRVGTSSSSTLVLGSASNYGSVDWNGSWVYANSEPLFLKSGTDNVYIYAGGTGAANIVASFYTTLDARFEKNLFVGSNTLANQGISIESGNGNDDYGRIRFLHAGSNQNTIHAFGSGWQSGTIYGHSTGAINLDGYAGVTFGPWSNIDAAFVEGGTNYFQRAIGIGQTTPLSSLHITQSIPSITLETSTNANDPVITLKSSGAITGEGAQMYYDNSVGTFHIQTTYPNDAADIVFHTATGADQGTNNVRMRIGGGGGVGIGDVSANGDLQFTNDVQTRKIVLYEGADNDYQFYGFGVEDSTFIYTTYLESDSHVFYGGASATTRTEIMRITTDTGVRVGTGSVDSKFKVEARDTSNNIYAGFRVGYNGGSANYYDANSHEIRSGSSGTTYLTINSSGASFNKSIIIGTSGTYAAGAIYSDSNWGMILRAKQASPVQADFMFANSADVERLRITSTAATFAGEVNLVRGINMTAGTSTLYATDGALSYYSASNGVYLNGAGASGWLRLNASGVQNNRNSINIYGSAGDYMNFQTANLTRLIIDANGDFQASVDQDKNYEFGKAHIGYMGHADHAGFSHIDINSGGGYALLQDSGGTTYLNAASGKKINFRNNNQDLGAFSAVGNLGVGTNDPDAFMSGTNGISIVGNYASLGLSNGTTKWLTYLTTNADRYRIWNSTNNEVMTILLSGRVGIGNDSPNHLLELGASASQAVGTGYEMFSAGAFGVLFRNNFNSYIAGNTQYTSSGWVNKYGGKKGVIIALDDGKIEFNCGTGTTAGSDTGLSVKSYITNNGTTFFSPATGTASGDHTNVTNYPYKVDSATQSGGYWRIPHISGSASISGVYNYETGKNVYWGEPADTGTYEFRGRYINATSSNTTVAKFHNDLSTCVFEIGDTSNTNVTATVVSSNSGNGQFFKAGSTYTAWGGASSFNIYCSNGDICFHPSATANIMKVKTSGITVTGSVTASGDVIAFSDKKVKTNIKTIDNALKKVSKLRGVSYNRTDIDDKSDKIGVIAQEVKEVLPEVVSYDDEKDLLGVDYGKMAGVFIEAIKELKAEVDSLKQEIKELKK